MKEMAEPPSHHQIFSWLNHPLKMKKGGQLWGWFDHRICSQIIFSFFNQFNFFLIIILKGQFKYLNCQNIGILGRIW